MATSHVASVALMHTNPVTGVAFSKDSPATTLGMIAKSNVEHRVVVDAGIPNTASNPTIKAYLILEAAAGFSLKHMDQYLIVTES